MRCDMYDRNKAVLAALKFLVSTEVGKTYKYAPTLCDVKELMPDLDNETLNEAMGIIFRSGYNIGNGELMFDGDCWHDLVDVVADKLKPTENYMTYQIRDIVIHLLGVDIDSIVSVLLQQKLIRGVNRYVNGRYITVYTKTW